MRTSLVRVVVALAAVAVVSCKSDPPVVPPVIDETPLLADTLPPSQVVGLQVGYDRPAGRIIIDWVAPHDNEPTEPVDRYEMRYSFVRGTVPGDFSDLAVEVTDPPAPDAPGTKQTYTLDVVERLSDFFVAIRAFDAADNVSPPSNIVAINIPGIAVQGRCTEAGSGAPVSGLNVHLSASQGYDLVTDANGEFLQDNVMPGALQITIDSGSSGVDYHSISQVIALDNDVSGDFIMIAREPTVHPTLNGVTVLGLIAILLEASNGSTVLKKWHQYPVPVYIPALVNINGFDYKAHSLDAMQRWNDRSGRALFEFVDTPPDTGIVFHYITRTSPGAGATYHTVGPDGHPIRDDIEIVDDLATSPYLVMLHEFGHTIRFGHLRDRDFIMYGGQPLPTDISDDESAAAALHYDLPTQVDLAIYGVTIPPPVP